jgi:hypothetical protein
MYTMLQDGIHCDLTANLHACQRLQRLRISRIFHAFRAGYNLSSFKTLNTLVHMRDIRPNACTHVRVCVCAFEGVPFLFLLILFYNFASLYPLCSFLLLLIFQDILLCVCVRVCTAHKSR